MPVNQDLLINRELSWLAFNERVLHEATRKDVPLLERLRFVGISANNLDEFFMVRVAGLRTQSRETPTAAALDGSLPRAQLAAISEAAHRHVERQYQVAERLLAELAKAGTEVLPIEGLGDEGRERVERFFDENVLPILTPLAVDQSHPFPWISNLSLNLAVSVSRPQGSKVAIVQVPRSMSRLVPAGSGRFVLLEDLMVHRLADLFPGSRIKQWVLFRFTRDAELEVDPEEVHDFRKAMESEIRRRKRSGVVRLEALAGQGDNLVKRIAAKVGVGEGEVYRVPRPLDLRVLQQLVEGAVLGPRYPPFVPVQRHELSEGPPWPFIRTEDALLHHPYESFTPVENFVTQAADDPDVLAIKMTLYRTGSESPIVEALVRAAERDKQVAVLMELLARFDEERNLDWGKRLERAGAHVIYGVAGLKTHAKIALVVRREPQGIRRYVHLGTGNYNARTAQVYTDLSLFTGDEDFGVDASSFFNAMTGYSDPPDLRRLVMAPLHLRSRLLALVRREAEHARGGAPAEIVIKANALVDPEVAGELAAASQAGVDVKLIVRGICCLRPGVPGLTDRIAVISIVDRFLEHSRVLYFRNGGREELYLSSADLMPRNLDRRVELMFPVLHEPLRERVKSMLKSYLADNTRAWVLGPDGGYREKARKGGEPPFRVQEHFQDEAVRAAGVAPEAAYLQIRPRGRPA